MTSTGISTKSAVQTSSAPFPTAYLSFSLITFLKVKSQMERNNQEEEFCTDFYAETPETRAWVSCTVLFWSVRDGKRRIRINIPAFLASELISNIFYVIGRPILFSELAQKVASREQPCSSLSHAAVTLCCCVTMPLCLLCSKRFPKASIVFEKIIRLLYHSGTFKSWLSSESQIVHIHFWNCLSWIKSAKLVLMLTMLKILTYLKVNLVIYQHKC